MGWDEPLSAKPPHDLMQYFEYLHLPVGLQIVSGEVYSLACAMDAIVPNGPQKDLGLQKLLEAKDCFVRAALPKK